MSFSDSTFTPQIKLDQNGVRILDPNPMQEIAPLEDMFIYISLVAKQRSKSVLTQVDDNFYNFDTRKLSTIDIAVPQQETFEGSKLFKSKPMLTTDWTEIGGYRTNIDLYKDYEGFGITNIDVKIQSQTAPQVVVDFVDVRGATLFEQGSCSPYGLFFKLPYPIFVLTLKGYYGRPVEYYLNLVKFNSKFNSETGNMDCRAEFIGYSFAFLSDMIMGYVGASQYLKQEVYKPQQILRQKYQDTVNRDGNDFTNFCDNPVITDGRCYTINDLLRVVNDFDKTTQPQIVNSPEFNELQNLTALNTSYATYNEHVNDLIRKLDAECGGGTTTKADFGDGSARPLRFEIKTDEIFKKLIKKDGGILPTYFANKTGILSADIKLTKSKEIKPGQKADEFIDMLTTAKADKFTSTDNNNQCPGCADLYNKLEKEPWNNIFNLPESIDAGITFKMSTTVTADTKFIDMGYIVKDIEAERSKLSGNATATGDQDGIITQKKKQVIESINKIVKQQLGFDPTIRNIFTILLCNTDAFMEILVNVAVEAEKYHEQRASEYKTLMQKGGDGNTGLISGSDGTSSANGNPKVYAWPTYYRKSYTGVSNSKKQGTKEDYPGNNTKFSNWVEVRFVEDFIDAYLDYNRDRKIINGEKEGLAGFDNYAPINPLESPALSQDTPIKYLDLVSKDEIYPVIGERLFIALDHSVLSPIRLTLDAYYIPKIGVDAWNPIKNNDSTNLSKSFGTIEAHNILNCQDNEGGRTVLATIINEDKPTFIQSVIDFLKKQYGDDSFKTVTAADLNRITASNDSTYEGLGFKLTDEYYVFNPGEEGILLSHKTKAKNHKTYIKPDPFNMENQAGTYPAIGSLITIVNAEDVKDEFKIQIVPPDGPMSQAINAYNDAILQKTSSVTYGTGEVDPKNKAELDEAQKIPTWSDPTFFTTLAMIKLEGTNDVATPPDFADWWTNKNIESLSQSNMGLLSYPSYDNFDGTYGISLFGPEGAYEPGEPYSIFNTDEISVNLGGLGEGKVDLGDDLDDEGASTSFVTTPLWLDNVIKFRSGTPFKLPTNFYIGEDQRNYSQEEIQNRNLAYLYLQTLKTTPFIIRYVDDAWDFFTDDKASFVYSLKAFNTTAGLAKVPKAWLLTLGAILWRWKMFVGTKVIDGKRVWNKPITCTNCSDGDTPIGLDPLAQPGWNSYDGNSPTKLDDRNRPNDYLNKVYGSGSWNLQTSCFQTPKDPYNGNLDDDIGDELVGGYENVYAYFPYFNLYRNQLGFTEFDQKLTTMNNAFLRSYYSWPMLWIAPHHIPYVHPECFYDNEVDGSVFVQLFSNSLTYIDYITLMNKKRQKSNNTDVFYHEQSTSSDTDLRNNTYDGNLGMVLQYIPDAVKDEILKYFDNWCSNNWPNLLGIVDPINFGSSNATLSSSYEWSAKISPLLGNSPNATVTLAPKETGTESLKKLMTDQVLIYNSTPKIWYGITSKKEGPSNPTSEFYNSFIVSKTNFELYLGSLWDEFTANRDKKSEEINKKTTEEENQLAGSLIDDDDIKLALYRTFKSLTDKWISSSSSGRAFFNVTDNGKGCGKDATGPRTLASHFQYVNRVMGDIGNIAMINVSKIRELNDNVKISLYQYLSDILTDNEYMFFPLPGYVDFTSVGMSKTDLEDMFKPILSLKRLSCGPVFLCMYVGGNSRQLKYKAHANCPEDLKELQQLEDDGFWVSDMESNGGAGLPDEITDPISTGDGAGYTSFKIVYGLENQNHFKNIQLDQSEFSETAESLLVIDKLSQQGGTDQTSKGQNLNTVYLTRSYSCQVESLGNMMIQPMTYFDLIGVPMFNGAYLITTVEHNFKPNHATTRFKGVRQPRTTVPVVTDAAIAMNMNFKDMKSDGSGQSLSTLGGGTGGGGTGGGGTGGGGTAAVATGSGTINSTTGVADKTSVSKILTILTKQVEGGYGHPAFQLVNSKDSQIQYNLDNSGETMFGHDRSAGDDERNDAGKNFWAEVDKYSGFGMYGSGAPAAGVTGMPGVTVTNGSNLKAAPPAGGSVSYSRYGRQCYKNQIDYTKYNKNHNTHYECFNKTYIDTLRAQKDFQGKVNCGNKCTKGGENLWTGPNDPNKTKWGHNYSPPEGSTLGIKLRDLSERMYITSFTNNMKSNFGGNYSVSDSYPNIKVDYTGGITDTDINNLVTRMFNDARLLAIFVRLTINGPGFFQNTAKDLKKYYKSNTSVSNDDLIQRTLTYQWNYSKSIHQSVEAMIKLIGWTRTVPS